MKIIFQIDGGMGKCIAATAVCKAIKTQYPDSELIVVSGHPYVFLCNDNLSENLHFRELQYFWQRNIRGQKPKMMLHNPYLEAGFILGETSLIQTWCEMFGINYNGEMPKIYLTNREQNFYGNQFRSDKPILYIQTNGGGEDQPNKYSWTRDLPQATAQQVVNALANDYHIAHIRRSDQLPLQNVTPIHADFRALAVLLQMSEKRVLIDSFSQHAAVALGKPSVVCLINKMVEKQFGYDMHTNIIANPPTLKPELKHAFLNQFNITGTPIEFPYNDEREIYPVDQIIEAVRKDNSADREGDTIEVKKKEEALV